ncbi:hypothetical protein F5148DRAFT_1351104 [Russula earlei]|uniref:Uncharacterized protein n=1 Tax=Russula earlei TaxID=71964 RepID=A0ACC0TSA8_9AGAM|nr:hypothetical protein F5148DRAFT_1351104 [Russula earlei]
MSDISTYFRQASRPNGCPFCAQPGHGVRWCTIAEEYCYTGRIVIINSRLHLPNRQPIPISSNGRGLKDAVDAWLAANNAQVFSYPATPTAPTPVALPSSHHPPSPRDASIITPTQLRYLQQELEDLIATSSRLQMRDRRDVSDYGQSFQEICEPLVSARCLSYDERDRAFWLGLHPDDRKMVSRRLGPWSMNEQRGQFVEFRETFDTLVKIFSQPPCDIRWERGPHSLRQDPRRNFAFETPEQENCQPVALTPADVLALPAPMLPAAASTAAVAVAPVVSVSPTAPVSRPAAPVTSASPTDVLVPHATVSAPVSSAHAPSVAVSAPVSSAPTPSVAISTPPASILASPVNVSPPAAAPSVITSGPSATDAGAQASVAATPSASALPVPPTAPALVSRSAAPTPSVASALSVSAATTAPPVLPAVTVAPALDQSAAAAVLLALPAALVSSAAPVASASATDVVAPHAAASTTVSLATAATPLSATAVVAPASPSVVASAPSTSAVAPALSAAASLVSPSAFVSAPAASVSVSRDTSIAAPSQHLATSTTPEDQEGLGHEPSHDTPQQEQQQPPRRRRRKSRRRHQQHTTRRIPHRLPVRSGDDPTTVAAE